MAVSAVTPSTVTHWLTNKHIIISGIGVAGCCFAISLHQACARHRITPPHISIYERDAQLDATKGYSLGLRSDKGSGGLQVLQHLGLFDTAVKHHITNARRFGIFDRQLQPVISIPPQPVNENMRLTRYALRKLLVDALPKSVTVHWGTAITSAVEHSDSTVTCQLNTGKEVKCDVLVAADGTSSKIRQAVRPDLKPQHCNIVSIYACTSPSDQPLEPPFDNSYGLTLAGDGNFMFVGPRDVDTTRFAVSWRAPKTNNTPAAGTMTEQQIDEVIAEMKLHAENAPAFHRLIDHADRSTVYRKNNYEMLPFAQQGSILFIGDSCHGMPPTAGNGANMAMMDGLELAEQMTGAGDLKAALAAYDKRAMPRSASAIKSGRLNVFVLTSSGVTYFVAIRIARVLAWCFGLTADRGVK